MKNFFITSLAFIALLFSFLPFDLQLEPLARNDNEIVSAEATEIYLDSAEITVRAKFSNDINVENQIRSDSVTVTGNNDSWSSDNFDWVTENGTVYYDFTVQIDGLQEETTYRNFRTSLDIYESESSQEPLETLNGRVSSFTTGTQEPSFASIIFADKNITATSAIIEYNIYMGMDNQGDPYKLESSVDLHQTNDGDDEIIASDENNSNPDENNIINGTIKLRRLDPNTKYQFYLSTTTDFDNKELDSESYTFTTKHKQATPVTSSSFESADVWNSIILNVTLTDWGYKSDGVNPYSYTDIDDISIYNGDGNKVKNTTDPVWNEDYAGFSMQINGLESGLIYTGYELRITFIDDTNSNKEVISQESLDNFSTSGKSQSPEITNSTAPVENNWTKEEITVTVDDWGIKSDGTNFTKNDVTKITVYDQNNNPAMIEEPQWTDNNTCVIIVDELEGGLTYENWTLEMKVQDQSKKDITVTDEIETFITGEDFYSSWNKQLTFIILIFLSFLDIVLLIFLIIYYIFKRNDPNSYLFNDKNKKTN